MTDQSTGAAQVFPTTTEKPTETPVGVNGDKVFVGTDSGAPETRTFVIANGVEVANPLDEPKAAGQVYADALLEETEAQRAYDQAFAEFAKQHANLFIRKDEAKRAVKDADVRVRNLADAYCQQYGVAPVEWVGTQMRTQVEYDAPALFDAALKYAPFLLVLDSKRVEQFVIHNVEEKTDKATGEKARTLPEYFRLPVTVSLKPTVTVSTGKLSKLIEDKPE